MWPKYYDVSKALGMQLTMMEKVILCPKQKENYESNVPSEKKKNGTVPTKKKLNYRPSVSS